MTSFGSWRWSLAAALLLESTASPVFGETPPATGAKAAAAPAAEPTSAWATSGEASQPSAATPVRRDPNGRTGISPAMEAVLRGDAALLARDFVAAAGAYQEAIKLEPQKALGHLRMASLHLTQGELDQAAVVLATAERFTGGDAQLTVQTLALKAMLQERRAALSDATLAWSAYALLARAGGPALGDPLVQQAIMTTASERKTVIAATLERQAAYAKVRERIEKGLADAHLTESTSSAPAK